MSDLDQYNLEKKFDPTILTSQQTNYLLELQSIYNELNNANLNLFISSPNSINSIKEDNNYNINKENEKNYSLSYATPNGKSIPIKELYNENNMLKYDSKSEDEKKIKPISYLNENKEEKIDSHKLAGKLLDVRDIYKMTENNEQNLLHDFVYPKINGGSFTVSSVSSENGKSMLSDGKPVANLPSLDDNPHMTLEEYQIKLMTRNNNKNSFNQDRLYASEFNLTLKSLQTATNSDNTEPKVHKIIRNINLASRKQPKLVSRERSRPPAPKLIKLHIKPNESKSYEPPPPPKLANSENKTTKAKSIRSSVDYKQQNLASNEQTNNNNEYPHELNMFNFLDNEKTNMNNLDTKEGNSILKKPEPESAEKKANFTTANETMISDSINRLTQIQIEYLNNSKYLANVKATFNNLTVTLNEQQKRLYFFGSVKQVTQAKPKIEQELRRLKSQKIKINQQLAEYLKIDEIKNKLLRFIEQILRKAENPGVKTKRSKEVNCEVNPSYYCSYQIEIGKKEDKQEESWIVINTNLADIIDILMRFVNESIKTNFKLNIKSSPTLESIKSIDKNWYDFYIKYKEMVNYILIKEKENNHSREKWYLLLTGFNENIEKFTSEFNKKFI
jgi:hypothetical protein